MRHAALLLMILAPLFAADPALLPTAAVAQQVRALQALLAN